MKKYISHTILFIALLIGLVMNTQAVPSALDAEGATVKVQNRQTATATVTQEMGVIQVETDRSVGGFLSANWGILSLSLLSFLEVITRLTPSVKDNTVLSFLSNVLNAVIPNLKKGGGRL